ncbi:polysaccharide biosynthesis protein [Amycolatopsis magusensis]|uniref:polysaccharide biosynthesis protein n=1 Tax=Amycolatopsis magusensis TaxID=882444 RepID=UPI0024A7B80E|nr:polysaccharide biosynthesis protein [Amycolatopsis magusensis]MDI5978221.1 polysaccharide biosynthesis protein [Amycolatopsis magusensis]
MTRNVSRILTEIREACPPGVSASGDPTRRALRALSAELVTAARNSHEEFRRYLAVPRRGILLPRDAVAEELTGRTVLVIGGSGCIGTALVGQLAQFRPRRIVNVDLAPASQGACRLLDVRDRTAVRRFVAHVRPDIVFHLAAQRDPGLAELEVRRTVTTNVLGTRNVVQACAEADVPKLVFASTGKALRPYSPDVYAASKRAAELTVTDAATQGLVRASAVRFTHVVDNSIVLQRFRRWCRRGEPVRLHDPDAVFYVQSALESAQLLLVAALSPHTGALGLHAIRDLGWPVNALDLAIGVMAEHGPSALQITGCAPGYEQQAYPGLFDPAISGDISPLLNTFEAPGLLSSLSPDVDVVANRLRLPARAHSQIGELGTHLAASRVRAELDELMRTLLDTTFGQTPVATLRRAVTLTEPHRRRMNHTNLMVDDRLRHFAMAGAARSGRPLTHR